MVVAAGAGWGRRRRREEIGFGDPMVELFCMKLKH
jgi:hypothetical protein